MKNCKLGGYTRRKAWEAHKKKGCKLYEEDLFKDKKGWGQSQETSKTIKPWACPVGHSGPEERPDFYKPRIYSKTKACSPPPSEHRGQKPKNSGHCDSDSMSETESLKSVKKPR